jgi:hypothetical protein
LRGLPRRGREPAQPARGPARPGVEGRYDKLAAPYKQAKDEAKIAAKIAAKKDDHAGATDAALALVEVEDKESTDNDLISAKETLSGAKEQYTDATKMNKLKISYCLKVLKDKGGASRSSTAEIVQS